jgi:uncharacterized membrane protein YhdT
MDAARKFKLANKLSYFAIGVLILCFFLTLVFALLPELPNYPKQLGQWRWFVASWNLAGPLMFIVVFRIHVLREMENIIKGVQPRVGVTWWVKFWFMAATFFGLITLPFLLRSYVDPQALVSPGTSAPVYTNVGVVISIVSWITLISSSIFLWCVRTRGSKGMLPYVRHARTTHRWLLVPASAVFFIFTGMFSLMVIA